jgi:hypothetical protein
MLPPWTLEMDDHLRLCGSPAGYPISMTEDAIDPTGERMNEPEGPDTPPRHVAHHDEKKEPKHDQAEREEPADDTPKPTPTGGS